MASSITQPSISHQSPVDVDDADGVGVRRLAAPKAAATRQQQAMPATNATVTATSAAAAAAAAWVQPMHVRVEGAQWCRPHGGMARIVRRVRGWTPAALVECIVQPSSIWVMGHSGY